MNMNLSKCAVLLAVVAVALISGIIFMAIRISQPRQPVFVSVYAVQGRSFALDADGGLWAWGCNEFGALGNFLSGVITVAAGNSHTMAIKEDNSLWAWGANFAGQIGNGTSSPIRYYPYPIHVLDDVIAVAAGLAHSMAVKSDNSLWVWGSNRLGELGVFVTGGVQLYPLHLMDNVAAVYAGRDRSMAVKTDGSLWVWGMCFIHGSIPAPTHILDNVATVSIAEQHAMAIKTDGTLWAWGWNDHGQIGDGTQTISRFDLEMGVFELTVEEDNNRPYAVMVMENVVAVSAGDGYRISLSTHGYTLALRADNSLWAWGSNRDGQLGIAHVDGATPYPAYPSPIYIMSDVVAIATGDGHSLAIKTDGTLRAWGVNTRGQLGNGTTSPPWWEDLQYSDDIHPIVTVSEFAQVVLTYTGTEMRLLTYSPHSGIHARVPVFILNNPTPFVLSRPCPTFFWSDIDGHEENFSRVCVLEFFDGEHWRMVPASVTHPLRPFDGLPGPIPSEIYWEIAFYITVIFNELPPGMYRIRLEIYDHQYNLGPHHIMAEFHWGD